MRILLGGIDRHDVEIMEAFTSDLLIIAAATADELIENIFACSPDVVVVDGEMPEVWGTLQQVSAMLPVPVVLVTPPGAMTPAHLGETDIYCCLERPLTAANLRHGIAVACTQFHRLASARNEASELREAFASRKLIDRAKGIIMQRRQVNESDAYTFLRDESRRQRTPIVEIAKSLLGAAEDTPTGKTGHLAATLVSRQAAPGTRSALRES
ncbi:MAG TPA: ANTAR domain-containing protein [Armatimonadota bacterium]